MSLRDNRFLPVAVLAIAGFILLGRAQEGPHSEAALEWEMFGQTIAVADSENDDAYRPPDNSWNGPPYQEGTSFLYNRRTGDVYRVFLGCGPMLGENGCLEKLPVVGQEVGGPPLPAAGASPNQIRR